MQLLLPGVSSPTAHPTKSRLTSTAGSRPWATRLASCRRGRQTTGRCQMSKEVRYYEQRRSVRLRAQNPAGGAGDQLGVNARVNDVRHGVQKQPASVQRRAYARVQAATVTQR